MSSWPPAYQGARTDASPATPDQHAADHTTLDQADKDIVTELQRHEAATTTEHGLAALLAAAIATAEAASDPAGAAATALTTAEGYTDTKVATEATARASADTTNASAITSEASTRATADTTNANAITAEAATARAAESANATAITSEATTRASAVTAEATTRASADTTNANAITAEASTARAAESANATAITAEASARAAADTAAIATAEAFAVQRANHTGTQAESTVTNLVTDLAAKMLALTRTTVKTANYTAVSGDLVPCDSTSGGFTVTLPAAAQGAIVAVKHVTQGSTNAITVACAGSDVFNKTAGATTLSLSLLAQGVVLIGASGIWTIVADDLALAQLDARYAPTASSDSTFAGNSATVPTSQSAVLAALAPLLVQQKLLAGVTTAVGAFDRWKAGPGIPATRSTGTTTANGTTLGAAGTSVSVVDGGILPFAVKSPVLIDSEVRWVTAGQATTGAATLTLDANLVGLFGTTNTTHATAAPVKTRRERHIVWGPADSIFQGTNTGSDTFVDRATRIVAKSLGGLIGEEWPLWRSDNTADTGQVWTFGATAFTPVTTISDNLSLYEIVQVTSGSANVLIWTRPAPTRVQCIDLRWIDQGAVSAAWSYSLDGGSTWVDNPVASQYAARGNTYAIMVTRIACNDPTDFRIRAANSAGTGKSFALPMVCLQTWSSYPYFGATGGIVSHNLGWDGQKIRAALLARTVSDVTTDGSGGLSSATAAFVTADVGSTIYLDGTVTTLASRTSGTVATSTAHTAAGSNKSLTIFQASNTNDVLRVFDGDPGSIVPDLTVLWISPNDMGGASPSLGDNNPQCWIDCTQFIINRVGAYSDVLIIAPYEMGGSGNSGSSAAYQTLQQTYRTAAKTLAASNGCMFLDLYTAFSQLGVTGYTAMNSAGYMYDTVHLAAKGQRLVGAEIARVLQET